MSSGAGLGQVQLGMERDMVSLPRDSVVSWGTPGLCGKLQPPWQAVTGDLWQDLGICPISRRWPCHPQCTFFPPQDLKHCLHPSSDLVPP